MLNQINIKVMFKIISKNKYEAMLTQIEGLKSINDRLFSDKNKLINEFKMELIASNG